MVEFLDSDQEIPRTLCRVELAEFYDGMDEFVKVMRGVKLHKEVSVVDVDENVMSPGNFRCCLLKIFGDLKLSDFMEDEKEDPMCECLYKSQMMGLELSHNVESIYDYQIKRAVGQFEKLRDFLVDDDNYFS